MYNGYFASSFRGVLLPKKKTVVVIFALPVTIRVIYCDCLIALLQVVPESLSADTGEKEPWDKSDAIELDRTDVHHENRSTSVHETLEPEVTETDDSSFKLDEEIDPDEHKDLLESDYAVPVVSDLPYDVNSLGKRKQFEDLDER